MLLGRIVTPRVVAELIDYDPFSGQMTWKPRSVDMFNDRRSAAAWNTRYAGTPALSCINPSGYRTGIILRNPCVAHRAAWAITYGAWPSNFIDHINGSRSDNRICNLRDVERIGNARNQKLHKTNTSGVSGVGWREDIGRWRARIRLDGKMITLGTFDSFEEAVATRKEAEIAHGYHQNHGRIRPCY